MQTPTNKYVEKMERDNNQRKLEDAAKQQTYLLEKQASEQRYATERIERKLREQDFQRHLDSMKSPGRAPGVLYVDTRGPSQDYGNENHTEGFLVTVGIITAIVLFIFFVSNRKKR